VVEAQHLRLQAKRKATVLDRLVLEVFLEVARLHPCSPLLIQEEALVHRPRVVNHYCEDACLHAPSACYTLAQTINTVSI
jgi:hypothetical protein